MRTNMAREKGTEWKGRTRRSAREKRTRVRVMKELLKEEIQEARGMVILVPSSFL